MTSEKQDAKVMDQWYKECCESWKGIQCARFATQTHNVNSNSGSYSAHQDMDSSVGPDSAVLILNHLTNMYYYHSEFLSFILNPTYAVLHWLIHMLCIFLSELLFVIYFNKHCYKPSSSFLHTLRFADCYNTLHSQVWYHSHLK
jgi:hypothetical protein